MATAGMRMLDVEVQEKILESCRKVLRSSGFKFSDDWASVITGSLFFFIMGFFFEIDLCEAKFVYFMLSRDLALIELSFCFFGMFGLVV